MTISTASDLDRSVEELVACLARVGEVDVAALGSAEQARLLRVLGRAESTLAGVRLRVLAAADRAGTAQRAGAWL
jgi:hypothetical protein